MIYQPKYDSFINRSNGHYREFNYDGYRNQCMDLFWFYLEEVIGISAKPYQGWGNPVGIWNNFDKIKDAKKNFTKIPNGPTNVPQKGDIMIYGPYFGLYGINGHIEVFNHPEGDGMYTFVTFGQNWPTGKPCIFNRRGTGKLFHGYRGCKGWLRPIIK